MSDFTPEETAILKRFAAGMLAAMKREGAGKTMSANGGGPHIADANDLNSRYGDPSVRKDPKRWAGNSYAGASFSQCPSDYLLVLAEYLEWGAEKDRVKPDAKKHANGKFYWEFNLTDAARARGWAKRNQGKTFAPPQQENGASASEQEDESF